jgi:hypothetical protein
MNYEVKEANIAKDKQLILDFWRIHFPDRSLKRFEWIYQNGPYGFGSCWTVTQENNPEIIGTVAFFPRVFFKNGKKCLGGITGDFGVAPNHRILIAALKLQKFLIRSIPEKHIDFLYGVANKNSKGVQKRAGFFVLGNMIGMTKILKSKTYIIKYVKSGVFAKIIGVIVDFFLKIFSREIFKIIPRNYQYSIANSFDGRFDVLWKEAPNFYTIIGERTSKFLNWRFANCPLNKYKVFCLKNINEDNLVGYIVFSIKDNTIQISDILSLSSTNLDILIYSFIKYARKENARSISISFFGGTFLKNKLKRYQFILRNTEMSFIVFSNVQCKAKKILDPSKWFFTDADNDF